MKTVGKVDKGAFDAILRKMVGTPPTPVTPKRKVRKAKAKPAQDFLRGSLALIPSIHIPQIQPISLFKGDPFRIAVATSSEIPVFPPMRPKQFRITLETPKLRLSEPVPLMMVVRGSLLQRVCPAK